MRKRNLVVVALAVTALLVAGGLFASNMGFKLNYRLKGLTESATGQNELALPYNQQTGLNTASQLEVDIEATNGNLANIQGISKFLPASNTLLTYPPITNDFNLVPGESYRVQLTSGVDYIIVGSHNPSLVINLLGLGSSATGQNSYAYPYHSVATTASALEIEIEAASNLANIQGISKFLPASNTLLTYPPITNDFNLVPGEGYRVQVTQNVSFVPNHY